MRDSAKAKNEFFAAPMCMFHITGFPQQPGVLPGEMTRPGAQPRRGPYSAGRRARMSSGSSARLREMRIAFSDSTFSQ
jgi:hypothetical protein